MAFISCTAVFIFHWYLVFTMRESDDFSSLSGVNGLPRAPCTTLSQSEPDESWRCHLAISSLHEGRKTTLMEESIFFLCWIWSGLTEATQAYKPAPQACTGGTKHDGCTTLSTSLFTLIRSSGTEFIWEHNLFPSTSSPIFILPTKLKHVFFPSLPQW